MANSLLGGILTPSVPATSDPEQLLAGLNPLDLGTINLNLLGNSLAGTALSLHGGSLTLPTGLDLGGILGTDTVDHVQLAANSILGAAELGGGDDVLTGALTSVVNGVIDGGDGNDTLTIGGGDATLQGGAGDDRLVALGDGNNVIDGGTGADFMVGGTGDDTYVVDNVGDTISEKAGGGTDLVESSISYTLGGAIENLTLLGHDAINATGNALANELTGNDAANILDGRAGADTMSGGAGDDTYYVDDAGDRVSEGANMGHDTVHSTISYTLTPNVEDLYLDGAGNLSGTGNDLDNVIHGNAGNNSLYGLAGNDSLYGGGGVDTLAGGVGDDTYYVTSAGSHVVENLNEGYDIVNSTVSYTLDANVERLNLYAGSATDGTGNGLDNTIDGNDSNNVIQGLNGADRLFGFGGNDTIYGGDDGDTIYGNDGNDVLVGGHGKDMLTGGAGDDRFVFDDGDFGGDTRSTADVITDFAHGDKIDLSGVDANTLKGGNDSFNFIGAAAFSDHAGELRCELSNGSTYLSGDTNGDGKADFMIALTGNHMDLTVHDLVL